MDLDTTLGGPRTIARRIRKKLAILARSGSKPQDNGEPAPDVDSVAGQYWDGVLKTKKNGRTRWWEDETTLSHINKIVCGKPLNGPSAGFHDRLTGLLVGTPARRAISVGCGTGEKERDLLSRGLVRHFDLYDISGASIEAGRALRWTILLAPAGSNGPTQISGGPRR